MEIESIIKEKRGTIIDVRTKEEFVGGSAEGSINIPLQEIPNKVEEIKSLNTPIILCCASGGRSGQATQFLSHQGIACHNAGSWLDVQYFQTKNN